MHIICLVLFRCSVKYKTWIRTRTPQKTTHTFMSDSTDSPNCLPRYFRAYPFFYFSVFLSSTFLVWLLGRLSCFMSAFQRTLKQLLISYCDFSGSLQRERRHRSEPATVTHRLIATITTHLSLSDAILNLQHLQPQTHYNYHYSSHLSLSD